MRGLQGQRVTEMLNHCHRIHADRGIFEWAGDEDNVLGHGLMESRGRIRKDGDFKAATRAHMKEDTGRKNKSVAMTPDLVRPVPPCSAASRGARDMR